MKVCIICQKEKELVNFRKNFYGKHNDICKGCVSVIKGQQNLKKKIKKLK